MKFAFLALSLLAAGTLQAAEPYSAKISNVLDQLRQEKSPDGLPLVSGQRHTYGGKSGAVYLLGPYVYYYATAKDTVQMLGDSSPVLRVLAAKCILLPTSRVRHEAVDVLLMDKTLVRIGPFDFESDSYRTMTVAEVVQELKNDPHFLPLDFFPVTP
jgi:hypothetical protein